MKAVAAAASLLLLALPGCSGLERTTRAPMAVTPSQPVTTAEPPFAAEPATSPAAAPAPTSPPAAPAPSARSETTAAPTCGCVVAKAQAKTVSKRRKRRPRHRKAAPSPLPTSPGVEEIPPGGTVNAEVKPMSVPVMSILGKRVKGSAGEDLGRVVDVLADASGRVRIAIIDFGGFLGVGNHRIAVDWPLLRFNPDGQDSSLLLSLSPEKLRTAPEYKDNPRPQTLMEAPAAEPAAAVPPAAAAPPAAAPPAVKK
jgi:hypothetical protein